jgi:hypothetical protein
VVVVSVYLVDIVPVVVFIFIIIIVKNTSISRLTLFWEVILTDDNDDEGGKTLGDKELMGGGKGNRSLDDLLC